MLTILIFLIGLACPLLPFLVASRLGSVRYFSPLHIVAYLAFLGVTLKVAVFSIDPDVAFYKIIVPSSTAHHAGVLFVFAFIVCLCAGYIVSGPKRVAAPRYFDASSIARLRWKKLLVPVAIGISLTVTIAIFAGRGFSAIDMDTLSALNQRQGFAVNSSGVQASDAILRTLYTIPRVIFVILVMIAFVTKRGKDIRSATGVGMLLAFIAILNGDRMELLEIAGFAGIGAVLAGWKFSLRNAVPLALLALALVISAGAMTQLRFGQTLGEADDNPITVVAEQITGSTYFMDVNVPTVLIARLDENAQLDGESYLSWTYGVIPRALWPDKPAVDLGGKLKTDVFARHGGGGINLTGPGEAFWNFGWLGCLMGLIMGFMYRRGELFIFSESPYRYGRVLLYPTIMFLFVSTTTQSSFGGIVTSMFAMVPLALATIWFFCRRKRQGSRAPRRKKAEFGGASFNGDRRVSGKLGQ
ncbi:O-antigen polymerase [Erythrobacter crassostreae]|uniref:Oligosaccharide repeat unit polymerase n=1 Tax=Erythrobacter crassostreae TaxID=2828328 RepID=A0A9X1JLN5_9SPHN|nr:O-antigen polymerase [Erythrobacter crassostrea]MBV7258519.1 oligosaccharide repeat unit polymerase [Erythrobacter crassostrea]